MDLRVPLFITFIEGSYLGSVYLFVKIDLV